MRNKLVTGGQVLSMVLVGTLFPASGESSESVGEATAPAAFTTRVPVFPPETPGTDLGPEVLIQMSEQWWPQSSGESFPVPDGWGIIANIADFLEICPTEDPAILQIREDFILRRNDVVVGDLTCTSPVSSIPIEEWTDELVVLHGLRTMYYMDRYMSGHLPWTDGSLYDWMRSKIGGINIKGTSSWCCEIYDNEWYIVVRESDDANRDFDRYWRGIAGNIGLYAHESRHVDGYPHVSCCGITNGCDEDFEVDDLTCYGIQWWLNDLWLTGGINVGVGCLEQSQIDEIAAWHLGSLNVQFRNRFCYTLPPVVDMPAMPGGVCGRLFEAGFESGDTSEWTATVP